MEPGKEATYKHTLTHNPASPELSNLAHSRPNRPSRSCDHKCLSCLGLTQPLETKVRCRSVGQGREGGKGERGGRERSAREGRDKRDNREGGREGWEGGRRMGGREGNRNKQNNTHTHTHTHAGILYAHTQTHISHIHKNVHTDTHTDTHNIYPGIPSMPSAVETGISSLNIFRSSLAN